MILKGYVPFAILFAGLVCLAGRTQEQQAKQPSPYREIPTLSQYRCLPITDTPLVLSSRAQLEETVARLLQAGHCTETMSGFLGDIDKAKVDLDKEALILFGDVFGGTGMAKASLLVSGPEQGMLAVAIKVTVPPPPLTPDTASFRFAIAVLKAEVRRVRITGVGGKVVELQVAGGTT